MMTTYRQPRDPQQTNQAAQHQEQSGRDYGLEMAMKQMNRSSKQRFSPASVAAMMLSLMGMGVALTGCGLSGGSTSSAANAVGSASTPSGMTGRVHGGQQPINGATIQLYAVGTGGYGSAATTLIAAPPHTDSNGNFSITGDFSCTLSAAGATIPDSQVYVVATGGNSGNGTNSAISFIAPLGDCNALVLNANNTYVQINEITTIGAIYALAPYMTGYSHVGAPTANNTGFINAVGNFNNLVNLSTSNPGGATLPAGATVPGTEIVTLANIMASCINSSGISSPACSALSSATGGATDTVGMMLYFAKNPSLPSLTALYAQGGGTGAPFQPSLTAQPNDWTIAIKYNAGGTLTAPYGIAIDAAGDAWVTNTGGSTVTEFTPTGAVGTTLATNAGPKGIAIDQSGNVWVTNPAQGTVQKFVSGTGTSYTVGSGPVAVALDSNGTAWVANQLSSSVSSVTSSGTVTAYSTGLSLNAPTGIAVDSVKGSGGGNIYVANSGGGNVVKLTNAGAAATGSPLTDNALQGTTAVGLDASKNIYELGSITGTTEQAAISQFTSAGVAGSIPASAATPTGIASAIAVGVSQAFATNSISSGGLLTLTLGSSSMGTQLGSLNTPVGVAIDASGDVWTANSGDNTVSEFIGLTTPILTPVAASVGP